MVFLILIIPVDSLVFYDRRGLLSLPACKVLRACLLLIGVCC